MRSKKLMYVRRRMASVWIGTAILLAPFLATAQLAPVVGSHHAGQSSDTGFQGAVSSLGGYSASVPIALPAARGSLPIPLRIAYGGNQVGAAGMGWDVPLSFISLRNTLAHRRPAPQAPSEGNAPPIAPERLSLTLNGARTDLVRNAANTAWVARQDNAQMEVRANGSGKLVMYDGNGLTFNFNAQGASGGSVLDGGNLYLLRSITGPGGTEVNLQYDIGAPALPGGGNGLSINLASVSYNGDSTATCFKHRVLLNYDNPAAGSSLLAMSMLNGTVLARQQKLISVDVVSKPDCNASGVSLRKYTLAYQTDPDTQRPQLQKVTMIGQQGTPERNVTMPVATYAYGALTDGGGNITYQKTQSIQVPQAVTAFGLAYSSSFEAGIAGGAKTTRVMTQPFLDVTGDGRPDFTINGNGIRRNTPGSGGTTTFGSNSPPGTISFPVETSIVGSSTRWGNILPSKTGPAKAFAMRNVSSGKSQYVDMNGDGRVDHVEVAGFATPEWVITLNTPDPADSNASAYATVRVPVPPSLAFLSGSISLQRQGTIACYRQVFNQFLKLFDWALVEVPDCPGFMERAASVVQSTQSTYVRSELRDINGDGYPDYVYDEGQFPRGSDPESSLPPAKDASPGQRVIAQGSISPEPGRDVYVRYNTAGVHLKEGVNPFGNPTPLEVGVTGGCGIAHWRVAPFSTTNSTTYQICGFEDVNGDGIADRITSVPEVRRDGIVRFLSKAALGTGDPNHPFDASATITLPGAFSRIEVDLVDTGKGFIPRDCNPEGIGTGTYDVIRTQLLRDMNGDGIPDYVETEGADWFVYFGTGTGFAPQKKLTMPAGLQIATERNRCDSTDTIQGGTGISTTAAGLFDLDGDGQPEVLDINRNTFTLDVYQLVPPTNQSSQGAQLEVGAVASVPAAGRLVAIDNGYGAVTRIGYRSAKEDIPSAFNQHHNHNVTFPEIVVAAVATTDPSTDRNPRMATVYHAFGNAGMVFNAAKDAFVFPGYRRSVELTTTNEQTSERVATITDTYGHGTNLNPDFVSRYKRNRQVGLVSDVTTIAGEIGIDPWGRLNTNIGIDNNRVAGTHYDYDVKVLESGATPEGVESCLDMVHPYDFAASEAERVNGRDECTGLGLVFRKSIFSYRGTPGTSDAITSTHTVQTSSSKQVDDFGRVTFVFNDNDLMRDDDDVCVMIGYALPADANSPEGSKQRMLNALASRTTVRCNDTSVRLAQDRWEYDNLPDGKISNGFVTTHIVSRRNAETGGTIQDAAGKSDVRLFDATYDANGNLKTITKSRDDGATLTTGLTYDAFGLVPLSVSTVGINANGVQIPTLTTTTAVDQITLNVLSETDANGAASGYTYDGFGRVLLSKAKASGGTEGALSTTSYVGFQVGGSGRLIHTKVFTDLVAVDNAPNAAGRTSDTYLDFFGRPVRTELALGADYQGKTLVVGMRTYDLLGRVEFEADPFLKPTTGGFGVPYGTTVSFNPDGTVLCVVRGTGPQVAFTTDEATERYPTCYGHTFDDSTENISVRDAASLLAGLVQSGVVKSAKLSAIGRVLEHSASKGSERLELASFGYDRLGNMTLMERELNPGAGGGSHAPKATVTWQYDSLGQLIQLEESGNAPQFRSYDTWGGLTQVQWNDPTMAGANDRRTVTAYDALGRITRSEDRTNGIVDIASINDYLYDHGVNNSTPAITATNVLGRLAKAFSQSSSVTFSYDGLGRVDARVFNDIATSKKYVEKYDHHADGSLQRLHLLLPDNAFKDEKVDYSYDTAARTRSIKYDDGTNRDLFTATGSTDLDVFGRLRRGTFGGAIYTASYADEGRRLMKSVKVATASQPGMSREIVFPTLTGTSASVTPFDPMGRERVRRESKDGAPAPFTTRYVYDELGQLATQSSRASNASSFALELSLAYDALGNIRSHSDTRGANAGSASMSYDTIDPDRIFSVAYQGNSAPAARNVQYDGVGNITRMPTRSNGTRDFTYFVNGRTKTIVNGSTNATFKYDAFGEVQQLEVNSTTSADRRHDKHFGSMISQRDEGGVAVLTRKIPGPGLTATRHGPGGGWTFAFGEARGLRFATDQNGAFVQDVDYRPYGEGKTVAGALPGTTNYTSAQWNGGDALAALGVSQLGARIYDPVLGRFMSRDPLLIPRAATRSNPYAFAYNDPVNNSDPTGLYPEGNPTESPQDCRGVCDSGGPGGDLSKVVDGFSDTAHDVYCAIGGVFGACSKPPLHESTTSSGGDTLQSISETLNPVGNGFDVTEYLADAAGGAQGPLGEIASLAKHAGGAIDAYQNVLAWVQFGYKPSVDTAYNAVSTGVDTWLMGSGPPGWMGYLGKKNIEGDVQMLRGTKAERLERVSKTWEGRLAQQLLADRRADQARSEAEWQAMRRRPLSPREARYFANKETYEKSMEIEEWKRYPYLREQQGVWEGTATQEESDCRCTILSP